MNRHDISVNTVVEVVGAKELVKGGMYSHR